MHPHIHAKSSVKKWGGIPEDYIKIHDWFDDTKKWLGHSNHRMFRHHSEGIFEAERIFGISFTNSSGKTIYTRYVGEQHVKEDCNGYIPSAKEWLTCIMLNKRPDWMKKALKIND